MTRMETPQMNGDVAAMRKALEFIKHASDDYEQYANTLGGALDVIYEKACAALAEPARNCDVYTHDEALQIWSAENENERNGCFDEWLYHQQTGDPNE